MEDEGKFYIGRMYDQKAKKVLEQPTLYDPDDFTTHGVVVGMTGSGKTGLCIDILEEAALRGIPALLIDPKGDIANLLLHFPDLSPEDFLPWVDPDEARREDKSVEQLATEVADLWRKGLEKWGISQERIERVRQAVDYAVYTPGSDAGFPVSVLSSLRPPPIPWEENKELLREKISSTVTALLGLVGIQADPVRSREHILLSNIFEHAWKDGQGLDLVSLIRHIQTPPFARLGAFEINRFFPDDDRFELAMSLNNLLASPSFQAWTEGSQLEIADLLWTPEGKPRQSVFYLAHLPDAERMFFVTLLLTAVEAWMRSQPGSPSLRALIYFDEVLGFLPPVANPPSKGPMLRLLKQARAFGIGLLLATQNPVDLDYKALSNAGTWFVGRLQTEQDKARLLDGLESAAAAQGGFKRSQADKLVSALGKRVFLLHNVHEKAPVVFQTRWAMAYLKGPITRTQLRDLNDLVQATAPSGPPTAPAEVPAGAPAAATPAPSGSDYEMAATRPAVPQGIEEVFLPNNLTVAQGLKHIGRQAPEAQVGGLVYRPALLAQATARYLDRKTGLDHEQVITSLDFDPDPRGIVRWAESPSPAIPTSSLDRAPAPESSFSSLEAPMNDAKLLKRLEKDFLDFVYRSAELQLPSNPALKLVAGPGTSMDEFRAQCENAALEASQAEVDKLQDKYEKKINQLRQKLSREERELAKDESQLSARKMEEMATHAENILGLFGGSRSRRRVSSSMTKRRLTSQAKADVEESREVIDELSQQLGALEAEAAAEINELEDHWEEVAGQIEETVVKPFKKDIFLDLFGVAWFPYWQVSSAGQSFEVPGFKAE